jgi:hypothetical protein
MTILDQTGCKIGHHDLPDYSRALDNFLAALRHHNVQHSVTVRGQQKFLTVHSSQRQLYDKAVAEWSSGLTHVKFRVA